MSDSIMECYPLNNKSMVTTNKQEEQLTKISKKTKEKKNKEDKKNIHNKEKKNNHAKKDDNTNKVYSHSMC